MLLSMKSLRTVALCAVLCFIAACAGKQVTPVEPVMSDADRITALAGKVWVAEYIHGQPVVDMSHTSMIFTTDGGVKGNSGCNTYGGSYTLKDGSITFGPMAATLRMCADALGDQEMRFFQSLGSAQTVSFENGLLHLNPAEGKPSIFAVQE